MITITSKGSFKNIDTFLGIIRQNSILKVLDKYGKLGVDALSDATPIRSGLTSSSWNYKVEKSGGYYRIIWSNSNVQNGANIAILLQYGHGTGTGGYVHGEDYINPAIRPIFDKISFEVWKVVTSA